MFQIKALLLATVLIFAGCGDKRQARSEPVRMGEKIQVGTLVYNVLETKWASSLGDMFNQRIPQQQFLLVKLVVTNSGNKEISLPLLTIKNSGGGEFQELQDGKGVDGWFGFLRTLSPAETQEGWIVFDVSPNSYSLECSSGAEDLEDEEIVHIELPFNMDSINDSMPRTELP